MSTSIREVEDLPLLLTTSKSFVTKGRALPVLSRLPGSCQRSFDKRRRQGLKTCILRQPGIPRGSGKVSAHGEACPLFGYDSPQAQAVLLSPHGSRPNRQAYTMSNEQP